MVWLWWGIFWIYMTLSVWFTDIRNIIWLVHGYTRNYLIGSRIYVWLPDWFMDIPREELIRIWINLTPLHCSVMHENNAVKCQASYRDEPWTCSEHVKINKHVANCTAMEGVCSYVANYAQKCLVTDRKCHLAVCTTKPEPRASTSSELQG